jgi:hypothetical protein
MKDRAVVTTETDSIGSGPSLASFSQGFFAGQFFRQVVESGYESQNHPRNFVGT